jgi:aerobic C4-dicarboxylate transport protein
LAKVTAIHADAPPRRKGPFGHLYFWVLLAIVAGALLGVRWPDLGIALQPLGDGFVKLVKMIIAPVIFLTITTGIAGSGHLRSAGRVALKAFAYFLFFSTLALIVGLIVANVVQPGAGMHANPATLDASKIHDYTDQAHKQNLTVFLMAIIPTTLVSAFTEGSILQVLLVAILFGVSLALVGEPARPVTDLLERLSLVVFRLVRIVMLAAPVGAFGAIAFTVGKLGATSLVHLGLLIATFYLTSAIFILVVLGTVAWLCGFSILRLIVYLKSELLLVLGTSSSEPALPLLMEKMERAGAAKEVVGLVVPAGYSFNLDGTNIYMTLAALFIAQATGVHLSLADQIGLLLLAMVSSKGAAGVTGSGFITLAATLAIVPSVPIAGLSLILGVDRFMSECRSLTNFIGNAVATLVVARWEGALDRDALDRALKGPPSATLARIGPEAESD